jgi:hypothetical protein
MSEEAVKRRRKPAETPAPAVDFAVTDVAAGLADEEPAGQLSVEGIEVVQVVQDMAHSVPLIAGKATVVRVYLGRPAGGVVTVRGEIAVRRTPGGTPQKVPSLDTARVSPTQNGRLKTKRHDLRLSLNFRLPASLTAAGRIFAGVSSLTDAETGERVECADCADRRVEVRFVEAAPLRVRLIQLRYRTPAAPGGLLPDERDVRLFRSWLGRAYPVSRVIFSQATVDTNIRPPFRDTTSNRTNAQLSAIRNLDVNNGADQRTHYYGMVTDKGGFMRGSASALPETPDPTAVASGPTGVGPEWDTDGSYGDWYGGHELAHTFGRLHPGFCDGNSEDDPEYPFKDGRLSNGDGKFVGFDVGDPALGVPMRALPGHLWHDVMTYCDNQWMSSHTYEGIRLRLLAEDALGAAPDTAEVFSLPETEAAADAASALEVNMASGDFINVVATINLADRTGEILYVNPVTRALTPAASAAEAGVEIRLLGADGRALGTYPVPVKLNACADPGEDRTGIVDVFIPAHPEARRVELTLQGEPLDAFHAGGAVPEVSNVRRGVEDTESALSFAWDSPAEAGEANLTYNVQVSTDEGQTWQTVAVGATSPDVNIDRTQFGPGARVTVRVIATDGFTNTVAHSEQFSVDDPEE